MALTIKKAVLWKTDVANTPGAMAATLAPLADQGINLELVMGYSNPDKTVASVEVFPVTSDKGQRIARQAGYSRADFHCVVIAGTNQPGLGRRIASALAEAGISTNFFVAQAIGSRYVGLFSFEAESEADLAISTLRAALKGRMKAQRRVARSSRRSPLK